LARFLVDPVLRKFVALRHGTSGSSEPLDDFAVWTSARDDGAAPLFFAGWWRKHYAKVAGALGAVTLVYYWVGLDAGERVRDTANEYTSFIVLIGSLFVVSGGIHIRVKGEATPLANVTFLLLGAVMANLFGTTGASMLLIRPGCG